MAYTAVVLLLLQLLLTQFYKQWGRRGLHASLSGCKRGEECKFCGTFDIAIRFIHHGPSYLFMLLADGKKDSWQIAFFVKWQREETSNLDDIFDFHDFLRNFSGVGFNMIFGTMMTLTNQIVSQHYYSMTILMTICRKDGTHIMLEIWKRWQGWRQRSLKHYFCHWQLIFI